MMSPNREYWRARAGRSVDRRLTPAEIRDLYMSLLQELEAKGYLQEAFGYCCVDDGFVPGSLGSSINERILVLLGYRDIWPFRDGGADNWDDDQLFDVMEFMFDHVSAGIESAGRYHSFSDCGWHFTQFDAAKAREEYRERINELLLLMEPRFEITPDGEIMSVSPDGLESLLDVDLPDLPQLERHHVAAAVHKFRSRKSTSTQRRDAVRDLADVLENMRGDVKEHMFSQDESALFLIANKFWIRHNKPTEHRDYDHDAWWSWLFYLYLASIELVSRLSHRDAEDTQ